MKSFYQILRSLAPNYGRRRRFIEAMIEKIEYPRAAYQADATGTGWPEKLPDNLSGEVSPPKRHAWPVVGQGIEYHPEHAFPRHSVSLQINQKLMKDREALVEKHLPTDFDLMDLASTLEKDGTQMFFYKGKPFLEMHPVRITTITAAHEYKVIATCGFRALHNVKDAAE